MAELNIQQKIMEFVKQNPQYQGESADLVLSVMLKAGEINQTEIDRLNNNSNKFSLFGFNNDINFEEELYFKKALKETAPISTTPTTPNQKTTISVIKDRYTQAQSDFDKQMLEDGWAGDLADAISKIWGSKNTANKVRADLAQARSDITNLELTAERSAEDFRTEFKRIYGIEYNPDNIEKFKQLEEFYGNALIAKTLEDVFNNTFYKLLNKPLEDETVVVGTNSSGGAVRTKISKEEIYEEEFNKLAQMLGENGEKILNETIKQAQDKAFAIGITAQNPLSLSFKWNVLKKLVKDYSNQFAKETQKACNGEEFKSLQNRYEASYKAAFGTTNDIMKRVNDYNLSQQKGSGYVKAGVLSAAMIGISALTLGTGTAVASSVGLGLAKTAATVGGLTAITEISDRFTSGAALKALREDGVLEYLKTASSMTDWTNIATTTISAGTMAIVMGGVSYQVSNLTRIAGQKLGMSAINTAYATAGTTTAANIAVGMGAEYLMTGEITVEGTIFNVTLAVIGGVTHVVKINQAANAQAKADMQAERIQMESSLKELGFNDGDEINADILKQRYKKLALEFHPDRTGDNGTKIALINGAYEYLTTKCQMSELQAYLKKMGISKISQTTEVQSTQNVPLKPTPLLTTETSENLPVLKTTESTIEAKPFASFKYRTYVVKNAEQYLSEILPVEKARHARRMKIYGSHTDSEPRAVTKDQIEAIDDIQSERKEYSKVQEKLRVGEPLNKSEQEFYDRIISAMTPTEAERTLWRSLSVYDGFLEEVQNGIIAAKGFSSTTSQYTKFFSYWSNREGHFIENDLIQITEGYLLKISVPEGTPVLDCNAKYTPHLEEPRKTKFSEEVILPEGKMIVKSIDTELHVIEVEFEADCAAAEAQEISTISEAPMKNLDKNFPENFTKIAKIFQGQPLTNSTIVTDSPKEQPIKHASETTELPMLAESNSSDDLKSLTIKAPIKQNKVKIPTIINEIDNSAKELNNKTSPDKLTKMNNSLEINPYEHSSLSVEEVNNALDELIKRQNYLSFYREELLETFDYENAKIHLKHIEILIEADSNRLGDIIKNGYFASKNGADLVEHILQNYSTKKRPGGIISVVDEYISFLDQARLSKAIERNILEQENYYQLSSLSDEEYVRWQASKHKNQLFYISTNEKINEFFLNFKDSADRIDTFREVETIISMAIEQSPENIDKILSLYTDLATTTNNSIKAFFEVISDREKISRQIKISNFLKENNIKDVKVVIVNDINETNLYRTPFLEEETSNLEWNIAYFDKQGNFIKLNKGFNNSSMNQEVIMHDDGIVLYAASQLKFGNNKTLNVSGKQVYDKEENLLYTETFEKSSGVRDKYDIYREYPNGKKYKIGLAELSENGDIVIEKNLVADNGVKTNYVYVESPDGSRLTYNKITNKKGDLLLEHRYKYKVIDENHYVTIENGVEYDIQIKENRCINVISSDGRKVSIEIGDNEVGSNGVLSKELISTIKQIPGSMYFNIEKCGLKKIGLNIDNVKRFGAHQNPASNIIAMGEYVRAEEFTLLHELAHMIQNAINLTHNPEIVECYLKERALTMTKQPQFEAIEMNYFLNAHTRRTDDISASLEEMACDIMAYLYSTNKRAVLETRGRYLQQYFPETFAKISKFFLEFADIADIQIKEPDQTAGIKGISEDSHTKRFSSTQTSSSEISALDKLKLALNFKGRKLKEEFMNTTLKDLSEKDKALAEQFIDKALVADLDIKNFRYRLRDYIEVANKTNNPQESINIILEIFIRFNDFPVLKSSLESYLFPKRNDVISQEKAFLLIKSIKENDLTADQMNMILRRGKTQSPLKPWEDLALNNNFNDNNWDLLIKILPILKELSAKELGDIDFIGLIKADQNPKDFDALTVNMKLDLVEKANKIPIEIQRKLIEYGLDIQNLKTRLLENTKVSGFEVNANPELQKAFFRNVINNNSEVESVIRRENFYKFLQTHKNQGLPLKYSRTQFNQDLKNLLNQLPENDKIKVLQQLNITLTDSSFEGFVKLNPLELNNFSSKSQNIIKQINNCLENFGKNNEILCDDPEIKSLLDSLIQGFPEFLSIIGKQDAIHPNKLDIHILETFYNALNHPNYNKLSNSDKTALKLAILMHDIGKVESVNGSHSDQSAIYANSVLNKFNLSQNIKENIIELIRFHHFPTENYNFPINIGVKHMANIMAECDYKARFGNDTKIESTVTYPKEGYQHAKYRTDHALNTPEKTYITYERKLSDGRVAKVQIADMRNTSGRELAGNYGWTASQKQLKDLVVLSHNCRGIEKVKDLLEAYEDPLHDFEISAHSSPFTDIWNDYENHGKGLRFSLLLSAPDHHIGKATSTGQTSGRKKGRESFVMNTEEQDPKKLAQKRDNETTVLRPKIERIVILDNISPDKLPDSLIELSEKYNVPIIIYGNESKKWY